MRALGLAIALLVGTAAVAGPAAAGEVLKGVPFTPNPFAMTPMTIAGVPLILTCRPMIDRSAL